MKHVERRFTSKKNKVGKSYKNKSKIRNHPVFSLFNECQSCFLFSPKQREEKEDNILIFILLNKELFILTLLKLSMNLQYIRTTKATKVKRYIKLQ